MNFNSCRLCLKKGRAAFVNALLIPELCKSVKNFFGFEILTDDRCTTKVCSECISVITDALSYKNRVLYNQECIQKDLLLQTQIQSIKTEDDDDSNDVVFVEQVPNEQEDVEQVTSSQVSPTPIKVKCTARKSTTKLPFDIPSAQLYPKHLCPKRLKIVCTPLDEKDIKRLTSKPKDIKSIGKQQTKTICRKVTASQSKPSRQSCDKKRIIAEPSKLKETNNFKPPTPNQNKSSANSTKIINTQISPINIAPNLKPTATVSPSDTQKEKVIWCSVPSNTSNSAQGVNIKSVSKNYFDNCYRNAKKHAETTITKVVSPINRSQNLPMVTITHTPVSSVANETLVRNSFSKREATIRLAPATPQMNVVNTVYLTNSQPMLNSATLVCRPNQGFNIGAAGVPQNFITSLNKHTYALPYSYYHAGTSLNAKNGVIPNAYNQNRAECTDTTLSPQMKVGLIDRSLPPNKVKVLSVNELNTRLTSPAAPPTISHETSFKSQRLPIRISLTKVRNEMTIKLTDSQGIEINYNDLDESEKVAVKSSIVAKESAKQFAQAFETCSPDAYTLRLLTTLGLSKTSFALDANVQEQK